MDINDIRLQNLKRLIEEFGSIDEVARLSEVSDDTLKSVLKGKKLPSGKKRNLRYDTARKLEDGCAMPEGWMDVVHEPKPHTHPDEIHLSADEQVLLVLYRRASPELRRVIRMTAELARKPPYLERAEEAQNTKEQAEASAAKLDEWSIKKPSKTQYSRAKKKTA